MTGHAPGSVYKTQRWLRVRRRQLSREPCCRRCADQGVVRLAEQVDHIVPMSRGGSAFDPSNLQSLCAECHSYKSNHFDKAGKDWSTRDLIGCDSDGYPLDASHPWYQQQ